MPRTASARRTTALSGSAGPRLDWGTIALLVVTYVVVAFTWDTVFVTPLKLLVVLLHEISHGLAAVATGGRIVEIQIQQGEAGHAVTMGGNGFLIYSAGYLGSLVFGVLLLVASTRTKVEKPVAALLGLLLLVVAVRFVPWGDNTFGKVFAFGTGALFIGLAALPRVCATVALRVVAVTSCLYVLLDIKSDVLDRPGGDSDAARLAELTGVPSLVWGLLWIAVSVAVTAYAAYVAVTGKPRADGVESPPVTL